MIGVVFLLGIYTAGGLGLVYSLVPSGPRLVITPMHVHDAPEAALPPARLAETYI
jgi:hypothetical protein